MFRDCSSDGLYPEDGVSRLCSGVVTDGSATPSCKACSSGELDSFMFGGRVVTTGCVSRNGEGMYRISSDVLGSLENSGLLKGDVNGFILMLFWCW